MVALTWWFAVKPERNKRTRMSIQSAIFEGLGVLAIPSRPASREAELFAFPNVRFDDQVDSSSQALASNHSTFDLETYVNGIGKLYSELAFQQYFRGRVV